MNRRGRAVSGARPMPPIRQAPESDSRLQALPSRFWHAVCFIFHAPRKVRAAHGGRNMPGRPKLVLDNVSMTFQSDGKPFTALSPVDLEIPAGKFISLIGPS